MTEIPTYQHFVVDAFTSIPYEGNPAAVIIIHGKEWPDEGKNRAQGHEWMVRVAREFNLSETAFILLPSEQADDKIVKCGLRWRTPTVEVNLCGHATLASSYVLAYELGLATSSTTTIEFQTKFSGILTAQATVVHDGNDKGNGIQMSLPAISVISPQSEADRKSLQSRWFEALGLDGKLPLESLEYIGTTGLDDSFLIVPSSEVLCALTPHYEKVASFGGRGVIVTCISKLKGVSFESRFFAPSMGQTEDPVTGSAHATMAPFWAKRGGVQYTTSQNGEGSQDGDADTLIQMVALQQSPRGGRVFMSIPQSLANPTSNDAMQDARVIVSGRACTVMRGQVVGF